MGIAHVAFNLGLRNQGCYGVHDDDIHRAGTNHGLRDLQSLLAVIRLGNVKIVNVYADILRIYRVKGMLRVDEASDTAALLYLCHHVQGHRGLTTGLRAIDLDDTSLRDAAQSQRQVKT